MRVSVLGDGGWGTTLSILLSKKQHNVTLWSAFTDYARELQNTRENKKFLPNALIPKQIQITADIKQALNDAEVLVVAIPSKYMRETLAQLKGSDLNKIIVVSVSKGLENKTLLRMSQLLEETLKNIRMAVLSGPTIAYEVAKGMPTAAVVASDDEATAKQVQDCFMAEGFRLYTCGDVVGVELGGALKNVIAIAAGICDGLGLGSNTKAGLMTRGLVEMKRLGVAMGADEKTFNGLSGLGDLITTCMSAQSRNHCAGIEVAKGKSVEVIERETPMVAEGLRTCIAANELAKKYKLDMPITAQAYSILYEGKDPRRAVYDLMTRERKAE
ncbi:MAG: NAD(P)H-dependent glycerol-3-phosphate dehydrogenase [Candidatus Omnitrophota bacterium]